MHDLGTLRNDNTGEAAAYGVNADGSIVVGQAENDDGQLRAFLWRAGDEEEGSDDNDVSDAGEGEAASDAGAGSSGGAGAVGSPSIAAGTMVDHVNTLRQVADGAQRQATASTVMADTAQFVLGQEIAPPAPAPQVTQGAPGAARPPIALRVSATAGQNADGANVALAGLTAAVGLGDGYILGGYLGAGGDTSDLAVLGFDGMIVDGGLYLRKRPVGGTGLTWRVAGARSGGDVTIGRPGDLPNTERAEGESAILTMAASAEIGYSFEPEGMRLTPFGRLTWTKATRDGYTESDDAAFPVQYDDYSFEATFASLGLQADIAAGARGTVTLTGGLELDIDRSDDPVTGTSDIPLMTEFSVDGPEVEHENRGFATARYQYALADGSSIEAGVGARQSAYSDEATVLLSIGYQVNF